MKISLQRPPSCCSFWYASSTLWKYSIASSAVCWWMWDISSNFTLPEDFLEAFNQLIDEFLTEVKSHEVMFETELQFSHNLMKHSCTISLACWYGMPIPEEYMTRQLKYLSYIFLKSNREFIRGILFFLIGHKCKSIFKFFLNFFSKLLSPIIEFYCHIYG